MSGNFHSIPLSPSLSPSPTPSNFFSHPSHPVKNSVSFYTQKILKKAIKDAKKRARKRFFMKKRVIGWGWKRGVFCCVCPCGNDSIVDHTSCISLFFHKEKNGPRTNLIPRGVQSSLKKRAVLFHKRQERVCEPLAKNEKDNKLFVREKSLKVVGKVDPWTREEKEFIARTPAMRTMPQPPPEQNPMDLRWSHEIHPILSDLTRPTFKGPPPKAPKNKMGEIIEKYPKKSFINKRKWEDVRCFVCSRKGHRFENCDNRATLRPMDSEVKERYLRFAFRQKKVKWEARHSSLEELTRATPKIWARVERNARDFAEKWNEKCPFDEWAYPLLIRMAVPYLYAIGTPPCLLTKAIAGDFNRYIVPPKRAEYPNHKSCYKFKEYMDGQLKDMLEMGMAIPIPENRAHVILPCKVVEGKKLRLVINGIPINPNTPHTTFHLPTIAHLSSLVTHKGMKIIHFDTRDAFYSGSMAPDSAVDQCIRWEHPITGKPTVFVMTMKIFGHHLSPERYMRLHTMIFTFLQNLGFPAKIFVDDGVIVALGEEVYIKLMSAFVVRLLRALWIIIREEKSELHGVTKLNWIGYDIDLEAMTLTVPAKARKKILAETARLLRRKTVTPRQLARVKGRIVSKIHAIPFASVLTASINVALAKEFERQSFARVGPFERVRWSTKMAVPNEVKEDVRLLRSIVLNNPSLPIFHYNWDFDVYVDTSETHTGAHSELGVVYVPIHPLFQQASSTARELWGVLAMFKQYGAALRGKKIRIWCDNLSSVTITNRNASSKVDLRFIHKQIVKHVKKFEIQFWIRWKARESEGIKIADALSKAVEYDEWHFREDILEDICKRMDIRYPTVDAFASAQNAMAKKYFSATWDPAALAVDFLRSAHLFDFREDLVWANPPFIEGVVAKTLDLVISREIRAIVCLPVWRKAGWWPLVKRFASRRITIDRTIQLYSASERWQRAGRNVTKPRWDTCLALFLWDAHTPQVWAMDKIGTFRRCDDG